MMKRFFFLILTLIAFNISNAQFSLNDYKYVIVEKQFHFQNEAHEYDLNRLTKFLFKKYGFTAIIEGETLPEDLKSNYCLALKSEVKVRGALRTKAVVTLRDCDNNDVFITAEGVTKEKDFKRAYEQSIRRALESFQGMSYVYKPNEDILDKGTVSQSEAVEAKKEIEELKAEIKELKKDKEESNKKEEEVTVAKTNKENENLLFAKRTKEGFEIVDGNSKIRMTLISTDLKDVYVVKGENAIVYKKGNSWYYSKQENTSEALDIKF